MRFPTTGATDHHDSEPARKNHSRTLSPRARPVDEDGGRRRARGVAAQRQRRRGGDADLAARERARDRAHRHVDGVAAPARAALAARDGAARAVLHRRRRARGRRPRAGRPPRGPPPSRPARSRLARDLAALQRHVRERARTRRSCPPGAARTARAARPAPPPAPRCPRPKPQRARRQPAADRPAAAPAGASSDGGRSGEEITERRPAAGVSRAGAGRGWRAGTTRRRPGCRR